jgi:Fic family protein
MDTLLEKVTQKKKELDKNRPLPSALVKNLEEWFKIELTYTSNAIEGSTLTRKETALVVEKGITVKGKTLKEHLEAANHAEALDFIKSLTTKKRSNITQKDLLKIHNLILSKIDDENAGKYRNVSVRIAGTEGVVFPNPSKVSQLMGEFVKWLHGQNKDHPAKIAADTHLKLVSIHPFVDGNGRTARLLLNLILMQNSYPPALIRKEDREEYINSINEAQTRENTDNYYKIIYKAINRSLNIYQKALSPGNISLFPGKKTLLKIGELSQETRESVVTIRHWTDIGLLEAASFTESGYQLYSRSMIDRATKIRKLQKEKNLSLTDIKKKLESLLSSTNTQKTKSH